MNMGIAVGEEIEVAAKLGDQMRHATLINGTAQGTFGIVKVCQDFYCAVNFINANFTETDANFGDK